MEVSETHFVNIMDRAARAAVVQPWEGALAAGGGWGRGSA